MKRLLAVLFATILMAGTTGCEHLNRHLCKSCNPCGSTPCQATPYGGGSVPYSGGTYDSGPYIHEGGETIVPGPAL